MTWKRIDVADLGDYIGYLIKHTVNLGWGDYSTSTGFLAAVTTSEAGPYAHFDYPECEPDEWWKPGDDPAWLGGTALWAIEDAHVDMSGKTDHPYVPKNR